MIESEPEFECGVDEPHEFEEFPGSRWGFARCINCGEPAPEPNREDE